MKINFLPKSRLGKWTVGLNIYFLFISIFFYIFAELLDVIQSETLITIFVVPAIISSVIALFTGIMAEIKNKDRSIMVFLAILVGLIVLVFILGEIISQ